NSRHGRTRLTEPALSQPTRVLPPSLTFVYTPSQSSTPPTMGRATALYIKLLRPASVFGRVCLEARVDPLRHGVEEVLLPVRVLTGCRLAGGARRKAVRRTLDDDEVLVAAGGRFVMDLAVADEIVRPHRGDECRNRDPFDGAPRGVVARAPVDVVERVL